MKLFFSILFIGLFMFACESATHIDKEAVIEEKVQERLNSFKRVIMAKCKKAVLEEAGAMADSIILERAKALKDSLPRPLKPSRPEQPDILELKDSLTLAPFLDEVQQKPASETLQ